MNIPATQKCDICKTPKTPVNGWWKVFLIKIEEKIVGTLVLSWDAVPNSDPVLSAVQEAFAPKEADAHLCGNTHLSEWLAKTLFIEKVK